MKHYILTIGSGVHGKDFMQPSKEVEKLFRTDGMRSAVTAGGFSAHFHHETGTMHILMGGW